MIDSSNENAVIAGFVERFERILSEIRDCNSEMKDIAAEAKEAKLNVPALKRIAAIRLRDRAKDEAEKLGTLRRYAAAVQLDLF